MLGDLIQIDVFTDGCRYILCLSRTTFIGLLQQLVKLWGGNFTEIKRYIEKASALNQCMGWRGLGVGEGKAFGCCLSDYQLVPLCKTVGEGLWWG